MIVSCLAEAMSTVTVVRTIPRYHSDIHLDFELARVLSDADRAISELAGIARTEKTI